MSDKIKKIIVRTILLSIMATIFGYIFWPQEKTVLVLPQETTTTTTQAPIVDDAPCLVLYTKDKDTFLLQDTPCIKTYIDKYINGQYTSLDIACRTSGDGTKINRSDLSDRRTKSFQFYLMELGVEFKDIKATSLGDTSPYPGIDANTAEGKIINRSCELTGTI